MSGRPQQQMPSPSCGRILHYRLSSNDVARVVEHRKIWKKTERQLTDRGLQAFEDRAFEGNHPVVGDIVPFLVVRVFEGEFREDSPYTIDGAERIVLSSCGVNGQAFLDGNDTLWVSSAPHGEFPGGWTWPSRS